MARRTFVLGGARSGKSAHAEGLVPESAAVTYVATSRTDPTDDEWSARIAEHIERRPPHWRTVEAGAAGALQRTLRAARALDPPLLVDDVATWLTGVLDDAEAWDRAPDALEKVDAATDELVSALDSCASRVVLVSSEVGLGIVPSTRSGRLFRDRLGVVNARIAEVCDEVVLLVAGIPLRLR